MRIVFMGTSEFAVPSLRALHHHHDVAAVVTCCDTPQGRGRKLQPSPVRTAAEELGVDVLVPVNLSDPDFISALTAYNADLFYVVAFRILPPAVFEIPPKGTVNLHASLLPYYRGASPINCAIINGETETGLTTFFIDENVDTGDIILQERVDIGPDETTGELQKRLMDIGAGISMKTVDIIECGEACAVEQPEPDGKCLTAPKLCKTDGRIDWSETALDVHNLVRGMNPAPGAYTDTNRGPLKIHRTRLVDAESKGTPGRITWVSPKEGFEVACGSGAVRVLEIQPPGKKVMDSASFVRGYRIEAGTAISDW